MALTLEVVSPHGVEYFAGGIDRIVVRRREPEHDPGSEIAIGPHHAPLLMQMQACSLRITRDGRITRRDVPAGVLEVHHDRVTIAIT